MHFLYFIYHQHAMIQQSILSVVIHNTKSLHLNCLSFPFAICLLSKATTPKPRLHQMVAVELITLSRWIYSRLRTICYGSSRILSNNNVGTCQISTEIMNYDLLATALSLFDNFIKKSIHRFKFGNKL